MERKLTNNLGLKLISIFLAFFIWLAVVNISNPEIQGSKEVPLEILNEQVLEASGKTYELLGDNDTVTVNYKVRTLDAGSVTASDFRAYIDLAEMYEPTGAVPVKIEVKNNRVDSATPKPGVVRVDTEDIQRKRFPLTVYLDGETEGGYREGRASISPSYIYVTGPVSIVGQINKVGIVISIEGANADLSGSAPVKCFDSNDNEITQLDERVKLSRLEIDYTLPILKVKSLTLNFETEGVVADGYRYTGIESSKNSVSVMGLKSDLAGVNAINIPSSELNMDGAAADKEVTIDIGKYLPEGLELAEDDSQIQVVIKVEPLEDRTFQLSTSQIKQVGASSQYSYQFDRDSVKVVIRGLKEDLDQLSEETLEAELDVSNMEPGVRQGEVSFELGAAYELVSCENPQIIVHDRNSESSFDNEGRSESGDHAGSSQQETEGGATEE